MARTIPDPASKHPAIVLEGDFNCPIEKDERSSSNCTKLDLTSKLLKVTVTETSLKDVVGSIGNGSVNYSWCHSDGSVRSRIDFVFPSRTIKQTRYSMVPCFFSDHRAIHFQGSLDCGFPQGLVSWKLNCNLL